MNSAINSPIMGYNETVAAIKNAYDNLSDFISNSDVATMRLNNIRNETQTMP